MKKPDPSLVREIAPTGRLRAALNMGNPVLAHSNTASERPAGVTIDLARAFGQLLGVEADLQEYASAGESGAAVARGDADIGFMAVDPKRAETLHFTAPYVSIDGCYLVRAGSPLRHEREVDRAGTKVVIGKGSAYGLFLARHLKAATLVEVPTSEEVANAMLADASIGVAAGVRQQLVADTKRLPDLRLLEGAYMTIMQAMCMARTRGPQAQQLLDDFLAGQRAAGAIVQALQRHGIEGATVL